MKARAAKEDQWRDESHTPDLPNHVIMEILSRLHIKTLMAVKCVCKSWLNLVSGDTHFAKSHHRRSQTELLLRSSTDELYLGTLQFQNNTVSDFKLSLLFYLPKINIRGHNSIDWNCENRERRNLVFTNSCNGFVCYRNFSLSRNSLYAVICNPVTGEFIPVPPGAKFDNMTAQYCSYGLGFSRNQNRYKLLRVICRSEVSGNRSPKLFAEICTFEKRSLWRNLGDCPFRIDEALSNFPYIFLEGKLHFQCPLDLEEYIDCFDFENEQFGKVPLPPPSDITNVVDCMRKCIREFWGCLSVTRFGRDYRIETWVMKEYGVKDSWTKAFSVANHYRSSLPSPLKYLGNGEVLMFHDDNTLALCDSVLDTVRTLGSGYDRVEVIAYTPTLVRLKDALAGYETCVQNANSRSVDPEDEVDETHHWWRPSEELMPESTPQGS